MRKMQNASRIFEKDSIAWFIAAPPPVQTGKQPMNIGPFASGRRFLPAISTLVLKTSPPRTFPAKVQRLVSAEAAPRPVQIGELRMNTVRFVSLPAFPTGISTLLLKSSPPDTRRCRTTPPA
jgi:hypothetical protein